MVLPFFLRFFFQGDLPSFLIKSLFFKVGSWEQEDSNPIFLAVFLCGVGFLIIVDSRSFAWSFSVVLTFIKSRAQFAKLLEIVFELCFGHAAVPSDVDMSEEVIEIV